MRRKTLLISLVSLALAVSPLAAGAQPRASDLSAASMLPVAVSVVAPAALLSGGAVLTVVAIEASAAGTVWVLQRASDGARASITLSADAASAAAGGVSLLVGSAVLATAVSAGVVLSVAGKALCLVPNALGQTLLHHERITR